MSELSDAQRIMAEVGIPADHPWFAGCGCWTCTSDRVSKSASPWSMPMCLCVDCGNKRCPKATHHDRPCSGSNDPGQVGSIYGTAAAEGLAYWAPEVDADLVAQQAATSDLRDALPGIVQNPGGQIMGVDHDYAVGGPKDTPLGSVSRPYHPTPPTATPADSTRAVGHE